MGHPVEFELNERSEVRREYPVSVVCVAKPDSGDHEFEQGGHGEECFAKKRDIRSSLESIAKDDLRFGFQQFLEEGWKIGWLMLAVGIHGDEVVGIDGFAGVFDSGLDGGTLPEIDTVAQKVDRDLRTGGLYEGFRGGRNQGSVVNDHDEKPLLSQRWGKGRLQVCNQGAYGGGQAVQLVE